MGIGVEGSVGGEPDFVASLAHRRHSSLPATGGALPHTSCVWWPLASMWLRINWAASLGLYFEVSTTKS